ncbi:MAG: phage holin family protein [Magnetospirillum sp.]|nr:phage holin family protein [Magnetospirillum sp.]
MADILPDRPLSSLFSELTRETASLFRQEIRLARAELADKARQAGWGAAEIVMGALLLFVALLALAAAGVLGLSMVVAPWLAALIVALVVGLMGGGVLAMGLANVRSGNLAPKRTMDSLRDNTRWAKEQLR